MRFSELHKLLDLDLCIGSRSYLCAYVVQAYPRAKLDRKRKNFVDVPTDRRMDTPEFQSTRSSVGDDLKIGNEKNFQKQNIRKGIDLPACKSGDNLPLSG